MRKKESGLICKLDNEKAYDHIRWEFVYQENGNDRLWEKMAELD